MNDVMTPDYTQVSRGAILRADGTRVDFGDPDYALANRLVVAANDMASVTGSIGATYIEDNNGEIVAGRWWRDGQHRAEGAPVTRPSATRELARHLVGV